MNKLFGMHLSRAALIVGSLYVIFFVYASIHATYNLIEFPSKEAKVYSEWDINTDTLFYHIFLVIVSVASLVASIFLVLGTLRVNHCYLLPWLLVGVVILIALSLSLIYFFYVLVISYLYTYLAPGTATVIFLANILLLGLKIYIWLGIQQFYMNISEGMERVKSLPATVPLYR